MRGGTLVGIYSGKPASITGDRAQGEAKTGLRCMRSKCGRVLAPDIGVTVKNIETDAPSSGHRYLHNFGPEPVARELAPVTA
ncbi:hypothetical protein BFW86_04720 [Pseudomonas fluorescens]|nr:hypothetical protein BFW86_04720 [Pseudomonas fluorescens]